MFRRNLTHATTSFNFFSQLLIKFHEKLFEQSNYSKSVNMRISIIAATAFALALIGLALSVGTGQFMPFIAGAAVAAVIVSIVALLRTEPRAKTKPRVMGHGIPVEDFYSWVELGEPAAGLRGMKPREKRTAIQVTGADFNSLAINAELLSERLSSLAGRHGFDKLTQDKLHKEAEQLAEEVRQNVDAVKLSRNWSYNNMQALLEKFEKCAAGYDRIANKLYEYGRERPEIVQTVLKPLRKAAEKISTGIREGRPNIERYVKRFGKAGRA